MGKRVNIIISLVSIAIILINVFVLQFCKVTGESMEPTYHDGDLLIINKLATEFHRMDVVVVRKNGISLIKRVVGLPGETIEIKENKVFIDNKEIDDVVSGCIEPGIASTAILLGEDEYFVLGDNRENSTDSRSEDVGIIYQKEIVGRIISFINNENG